MLNRTDQLKIEALFLAQAFETYWAYYLQSGGRLYSEKAKEVAGMFLEAYEELSEHDQGLRDPAELRMGTDADLNDILGRFRAWTLGESPLPYEYAEKSRFLIWFFLTAVQGRVASRLGLRRVPSFVASSQEFMHAEDTVRWKGHLPDALLTRSKDISELIRAASEVQTIAVLADIRMSQDLMTYAPSAEDFSRRMVEFVVKARELADRWYGLFDKFTGDGFLVYFNEEICRQGDLGHIDALIGFLMEQLDFSQTHFGEWEKVSRKLPAERVGLAIGADLGMVQFSDVRGHLVAVGDAIVWAARMASEASANEVLVNNRLFQSLTAHEKDLAFTPRTGTTKAGETFIAHSLRFRTDLH